MLQVDKLPSDHLYKFLTFFGIFLISLSFWVEQRQIHLQNQIIDFKCHAKILTYQLQEENARFKVLVQTKQGMIDKAKSLIESHDKKAVTNYFAESKSIDKELIKQKDEITKRVSKLRETAFIRDAESEKIKMMTGHVNQWGVLASLARVIGIILFFGGLYLWYVKIQLPSDLEFEYRSLNKHPISK